MPTFTHRVGTTPTRALISNPKRKSYSIVNDSSVDVFAGKSRNVATSGFKQGINLRANGGSLEDEFHKGEVWTVANTATTVTVVEDVEGEEF